MIHDVIERTLSCDLSIIPVLTKLQVHPELEISVSIRNAYFSVRFTLPTLASGVRRNTNDIRPADFAPWRTSGAFSSRDCSPPAAGPHLKATLSICAHEPCHHGLNARLGDILHGGDCQYWVQHPASRGKTVQDRPRSLASQRRQQKRNDDKFHP